jgi:hypothetical protein
MNDAIAIASAAVPAERMKLCIACYGSWMALGNETKINTFYRAEAQCR